jgi:hypothetical protein
MNTQVAPPEEKKTVYRVTRQVIFSQEIEIEAENEDDAIEISQSCAWSVHDGLDFLDTDYYNAEEITEN